MNRQFREMTARFGWSIRNGYERINRETIAENCDGPLREFLRRIRKPRISMSR